MDPTGEIPRAAGLPYDPPLSRDRAGDAPAAGGGLPADSATIDPSTQALLQAMAAMAEPPAPDAARAERIAALREAADRGALVADARATALAMVDEEEGA